MGPISPIQYQSGVPVNPDTPHCYLFHNRAARRIHISLLRNEVAGIDNRAT